MGLNSNCQYCPGKEFAGYEGIKGSNYEDQRIFFILHCPDSRVLIPDFFDESYFTTLSKVKTGKTIKGVLEHCNLTKEDIFLTNLFKCLLPNNRMPKQKEYQHCLSVLEEQIEVLKPQKIVTFGRMPYQIIFPEAKETISKAKGQILSYKNIETLISLHPSRIWALRNEELIKKEYKMIKDFLL